MSASKRVSTPKITTLSSLTAAMMLAGCLDSGGGDGEDTSPPALSGVVSSPGGQVAFLGPSLQDKFLAMVLGKSANAAVITGVDVVPGATVELYEVDQNGTVVGDLLATATSGSDGSYSLTLPDDFSADTKYVVRVSGQADVLESRVAQTDESVDIDPVSTVASEKITAITSTSADGLAAITAGEAALIESEYENVALQLDEADTQGLDLSDLKTLAETAVTNDEAANNIVSSVSASESICGNVVDSAGNPLENILMIARDFGNWVTRAKTKTDANGNYCINVPDGSYILGALNFTATSMGASEWWSATGDKYSQIDADKITVATSATVTGKDFALEPGARLSGKITADGGTLDGESLRGVRLIVRDYNTFFPISGMRSREDGSYRVNVIPGDYVVETRNQTRQPYGSAVYKAGKPAGSRNRNKGSRVTLAAGDSKKIGFALTPGHLVYGQVIDPATGAVSGQRVRLNPLDSNNAGVGSGIRMRTNKEGKFRVWLKPGNFSIDSYGQRGADFNLPSDTSTVVKKEIKFSAEVGKLTAILQDANSNPVSQAKVNLYHENNGFISNTVSNADGSVEMVSDTAGNHIVSIRIDDGRDYGSIIVDNQKQRALGELIPVTLGSTSAAPDAIALPAGGTLTGTVTNADGTPAAATRIQVRFGDTQPNNIFMNTRTKGDGTYTLSLPAETYARVRAGKITGTNADDVSVTAGQTTTQDFVLP